MDWGQSGGRGEIQLLTHQRRHWKIHRTSTSPKCWKFLRVIMGFWWWWWWRWRWRWSSETYNKPSILRTVFPLTAAECCKAGIIIPTLQMCKLKLRWNGFPRSHGWQVAELNGASSSHRGDHGTSFGTVHPVPSPEPSTPCVPNA